MDDGRCPRSDGCSRAPSCHLDRSQRAERRLRLVGTEQPHSGGPIFRAAYGQDGLNVSGYWLPETPTRVGRYIEFALATGHTLLVTGASGSGKSTLLNALATELGEAASVTAVLSDDYLFTGTVAS